MAVLRCGERTLDVIALHPNEPLAPIEIAPTERTELAEPEAGSDGTQQERVPLRKRLIRRLEKNLDFLARIRIDGLPGDEQCIYSI
jgi:hypothetical protein